MYVCSHNTEKVVYFLLLDRKLRNPCKDDDEDIKAKSECGNNLCNTDEFVKHYLQYICSQSCDLFNC